MVTLCLPVPVLVVMLHFVDAVHQILRQDREWFNNILMNTKTYNTNTCILTCNQIFMSFLEEYISSHNVLQMTLRSNTIHKDYSPHMTDCLYVQYKRAIKLYNKGIKLVMVSCRRAGGPVAQDVCTRVSFSPFVNKMNDWVNARTNLSTSILYNIQWSRSWCNWHIHKSSDTWLAA